MRGIAAAIGALALIASVSPLVAEAQETSPMNREPKGAALRIGRVITQSYRSPPQLQAALGAVGGAQDVVAVGDVLETLYADPEISKRAMRGLQLLPKAVLKIPLGVVPGPGQPAEKSLHKFDFDLSYNGVRFSRFSGESILIGVAGKERMPLYIRERNIPDLDTLGDTAPTAREDEAINAGKQDLAKDGNDVNVNVDTQREPIRREFYVQVGANYRATLAWAFVLRSSSRARPFARRYWVTAKSPATVLHKEDLVYHAGAQGTVISNAGRVTGDYWGIRSSPYDQKESDAPLPDYFAVGNIFVTDQDGRFHIPAANTPAKVGIELAGPYCRIVDENQDPNKKIWDPAPNGGLSAAFKSDDELQLAQVSAFRWVNFAHEFVFADEFVRDKLPPHPSKLMNIQVHVNLDTTFGDSSWDPLDNTLNFSRAGAGFPNMAYASVVFHEFGHAVDDQFGGMMDPSYSEGFGDALSMLITGQSFIAKDYFPGHKPLRDAAVVVNWPPNSSMNRYQAGQIYAGFVWQLTLELSRRPELQNDKAKVFAIAKDLILGAAAQNPGDILDAVQLSFYYDFQKRSPYFDELARAADSRGIPRPRDRNVLAQPKNIALSAANKPEAEDVAAYYKDFRTPDYQVARLPAERPSQSRSMNVVLMANSMAMRSPFSTAGIYAVDSGEDFAVPKPTVRRRDADVLDLSRAMVRELLRTRNPWLQTDHGVLVNLAPPAVDKGRHNNTEFGAIQEAARQQIESRWSVNFGLAYKHIPLDQSSSVSVLVRGDDSTLIEWHNLPARDLDDQELAENVGESQAQSVSKADFLNLINNSLRERNGNHAPFKDNDLIVSKPTKKLWIGPDGAGLLFWDLSVAAKPRKDVPRPVAGVKYWIEARTNKAAPKVLARSQSLLHAGGGTATGTVWPANTDCSDRKKWEFKPLSNLLVPPDASVALPPEVTDKAGLFLAKGFGNNPVAVNALEGTVCLINDMSLDGELSSVKPSQIKRAQPYTVQFATDSINEAAQINAFYWVNRGFDYYNDQFPQGAIHLKAILKEQKITVCTNVTPDLLQDASYHADSRQLFLPASVPANPNLNGSCRDYILHEFAHAIDWTGTPPPEGNKLAAVPGSPLAKAFEEKAHLAKSYSEGFADAFVILCNGDDEMAFGKAMRPNGGHVRDYSVENDLKLGDFDCFDCYHTQFGDDKIHFAGRVYAHFVRDLIARFRKRMPRQQAFDDVARLVLEADSTVPSPTSIRQAVQAMHDIREQDVEVQADIQAAALKRGVPVKSRWEQ